VKTPRSFAAALSKTHLPSVFNPYGDCCPVHDRPDAARVRKRNLVRCLEAALAARVDTIWIARDLGYRGGRRTGVPLTDEIHLSQAGALLGGIALDRATRGPIVAERTAAIVWRVLSRLGEPAVLWNIFPLHPHEADDPFSNRCHTRVERDATWPLLTALIAMIQPRRIVAIGRDAGVALAGIDIPVQMVRHPSYGGQAEFSAGIHEIYGVVENRAPEKTLELPLVGGHAAIVGTPA
jgi:uracil-DNA glycosylase